MSVKIVTPPKMLATVSRAFKRDASVNAETRAVVQQAAEKLGYLYDSTAQAFRSQRSGFLAITLPSAPFRIAILGLLSLLLYVAWQKLTNQLDIKYTAPELPIDMKGQDQNKDMLFRIDSNAAEKSHLGGDASS